MKIFYQLLQTHRNIYIYIYSSLSLDKGYGNTGYIYIDLYCPCLDIYLVVYLKYMS